MALVAVQPLRTLDIEAVAERYRRAFGLEVEVLPAVSEAAVASAFVADRRQHEAGRMMGAMLAALPAAPRAPPRWVIGLTDADLFLDDRAWRFCFSSWRPNTGIVSTARTGDGDTDTLTTAVRTSKLLTRLLAETYCGLLRGGPDDSVLRPTLMGVDDLDLIDESVWLEGPVSM